MSEKDWLNQDADYKGQESASQKAMSDFLGRYNMDLANYGTEFTAKTGQLEKDRDFSLDRLMEDYASRGMVRSGLYSTADNQLDGKFNDMSADFGRAKGQFEGNLAMDKQGFETDNNLGLQRAKQDALGRRAAKYGLV
jgi:hypothetical protein